MVSLLIVTSSLYLLYQTRKKSALFLYCFSWVTIVCIQYGFFALRLNDGYACIPLVYSNLCRADIELAAKYLATNNLLMIATIFALQKVRFKLSPVLGLGSTKDIQHSTLQKRNEKIYIVLSSIFFYYIITGGSLDPTSAISAGSDTATRNLASITILALLPRLLIYRQFFVSTTFDKVYHILFFVLVLTSLLISRITAVALIGEYYIIWCAASTYRSNTCIDNSRKDNFVKKVILRNALIRRFVSVTSIAGLAIGIFLYGSFRHEYSISRHQNLSQPVNIELLVDKEKAIEFGEVSYFQSVSTFAGIVAATNIPDHRAQSLISSFINNSTAGVVRNLIPSASLKDKFSEWVGLNNNSQPLTILPSVFEFTVLILGLNSLIIVNVICIAILFYLQWLLLQYPLNKRYNEVTLVPIVAIAVAISVRGAPWGSVSSTLATLLLGMIVFRLFPLYGK